MTIRTVTVFAVIVNLIRLIVFQPAQVSADTLVVDDQLLCNNLTTIHWQNDQLTATCDETTSQRPEPPPATIPPMSEIPVSPEPITPLPLPPFTVECPDPGPNVRIEQFSGRGIDQEFTLDQDSVLVVPFNSGDLGTVKKIALGEPGRGDHFRKTVIISPCPGVYNPSYYDFARSVDVCVITGLELSFSVIAGNSREAYPISHYRCVLLPNQKYNLTIFQLDAGSRPPFTDNITPTCQTNECGVRVSIR